MIHACPPYPACADGGIPSEAIRDFVNRLAITKSDGVVEMAALDFSVRETLNKTSERRMGVLDPLKLVITNYPEGQTEELTAKNHPGNEDFGTRMIPFSRVLYVDRDDFMEDAPKKFFRLSLGREVRLKYAYYVTCTEVIKNDAGEVIELRCTYDPETKGGDSADGRKVKGTIHWVSAQHAISAELRLYNELFTEAEPGASGNFLDDINPNSLEVLNGAKLEPSLAEINADQVVQFERQAYFCLDPDAQPDALVFNRTIGLRDSWAKIQKKS